MCVGFLFVCCFLQALEQVPRIGGVTISGSIQHGPEQPAAVSSRELE